MLLTCWIVLMFSTLVKNFQQTTFWNIFFLIFLENRIWHFMQIVSKGDNLHEMSNPDFWEKKKKKKNITNFLSAEFAQRVWRVSQSWSEKNNFYFTYQYMTVVSRWFFFLFLSLNICCGYSLMVLNHSNKFSCICFSLEAVVKQAYKCKTFQHLFQGLTVRSKKIRNFYEFLLPQ